MKLLSLRKKKPVPSEQVSGEDIPFGLTYQVFNVQGIGSREEQEDSFGIFNAFTPGASEGRGILALLSDGMGGLNGGQLASETAVASMRESFKHFHPDEDPAPLMRDMILRAAKAVQDKLSGAGGSTAIAALIRRDYLYYAGAGDSGLYLKRGEQLVRLNRLNNVRTDILEQTVSMGSMDRSLADRNEEQQALTKFLGMPGEPGKIDSFLRPLRLKSGDVLLLCSDGVDGVLEPGELCECLSFSTPKEAGAAIESLIRKKNRRGQDNYTAVIIRCENGIKEKI